MCHCGEHWGSRPCRNSVSGGGWHHSQTSGPALAERAQRREGEAEGQSSPPQAHLPASPDLTPPASSSAPACSPSPRTTRAPFSRGALRGWGKFGTESARGGGLGGPRRPPPARGWVETAREEPSAGPRRGASLRKPLPARIQRDSEGGDGNKYL